MDEAKLGRRERRRRKVEENQLMKTEIQKVVENPELSMKLVHGESPGNLVRQETYTVLHTKSHFTVSSLTEDLQTKSESSKNDSSDSRNLTYSLNNDDNSLNQRTFNVDKPSDSDKVLPVPAPRKRGKQLDNDKVSSDTDRDITEIDLDDLRTKSPGSDESPKQFRDISDKLQKPELKSNELEYDLVVPVPKPRKAIQVLQRNESDVEKSISKTIGSESPILNSKNEVLQEKVNEPEGDEDSSEKLPVSKELPLVTDLQGEAKPETQRQKLKKQRVSITNLLDRTRRNKKSKMLSSLIKKENSKPPKVSSVLKELKEEERKPEIEDKTDFQIDSPHFTESVQNGRIYVQGKNRFYVMERDEVLKKEKKISDADETDGTMEVSTVKTAVLFQSFWSRCMTYFHGVLAGIGFSHAATITVLMFHNNYEPQAFIADYSCLSLKIHYVFYTLITLCIVSCFDRIDIGHINRRHWEKIWKLPTSWLVLLLYTIGFVLTFANQKTEAKMDAHLDGNDTDVWGGQSQSEIHVTLLEWYHTVWARDGLVLFAWLVIALTDFEDLLHSHINNMAKYANVKAERSQRHAGDFF